MPKYKCEIYNKDKTDLIDSYEIMVGYKDASRIAFKAMEYYCFERCEFVKKSWPLVLAVFDNDMNKIGVFEVEKCYIPSFSLIKYNER